MIEALIGQGINVNITLIFSLDQYVATVDAYLKGLNAALHNEKDLSRIRSVASIFVSRIDSTIDKMIEEKIPTEPSELAQAKLKSLQGQAAVANCKVIFQRFYQLFSSESFKALTKKGANVQRVLWASTGTKNSEYSDIKYVTELIADQTVNTLPEKTIQAFLDHGDPAIALTSQTSDGQEAIDELRGFGIDINEVCLKLLKEGVAAFEKSFDELMTSIDTKAKSLSLKP